MHFSKKLRILYLSGYFLSIQVQIKVNYLYKLIKQMQSLKKSSIIQKFVSIFKSKKFNKMQNIFGNIELMPLQFQTIQAKFDNKQHDITNQNQRKSFLPNRKTLDYQSSKKRSQNLKQIQQIKSNILKTKQKNLALYRQISQILVQFSYVLFEAKHFMNSNQIFWKQQQIKIYQQKLLSQLDKLYEQNFFLEKQLNKAKFHQQNDEKLKQQQVISNTNHFQFLRNVWNKKNNKQNLKFNYPFYSHIQNNSLQPNNNQIAKSDDLIQRLNQKIAMVRTNINLVLKEEQSNDIKSVSNWKAQNDFVVETQKYKSLLLQYQRKSMELEDQKSFLFKLKQSRERQSCTQNQKQINRKIQDLKTFDHQNQNNQTKLQNLALEIKKLRNYAKNLQKTIKEHQNTIINLNRKLITEQRQQSLNQKQLIQNQVPKELEQNQFQAFNNKQNESIWLFKLCLSKQQDRNTTQKAKSTNNHQIQIKIFGINHEKTFQYENQIYSKINDTVSKFFTSIDILLNNSSNEQNAAQKALEIQLNSRQSQLDALLQIQSSAMSPSSFFNHILNLNLGQKAKNSDQVYLNQLPLMESNQKSTHSASKKKLNTERQVLLKKAQKLNQSFNSSKTSRGRFSIDKFNQTKTDRKEIFNKSVIQDVNILSKNKFRDKQNKMVTQIEFPNVSSSMNLQSELFLRQKFVRTSNRNKQPLR